MFTKDRRFRRVIGTSLCLLLTVPAIGQAQVERFNTARADVAITAESRAVSIDVLDNDVGSRPLRLLLTRQPQHGRARIAGGEVVYQPKSGYLGTDRFSYFTIGRSGIGMADVRVDVGRALIVQGTVTDAPIADAQVTASVGEHVFTTQADGEGNYSLEVIADGGDMLAVGARGGPQQVAVSFLSVLGQFDRLLAEAGVDGVLERDENNQVQVTHLSTAQAFLLQAANGGEPIDNDAELLAAREALDMTSLLQMAAAIKLVVDQGYPLPAGTSDTLALISDAEAFAQFVADVEASNPGALEAAAVATIADPAIVVPLTAADYVGNYTLLRELGAPGTVRIGIGQGERLELAADGTGQFFQSVPNADPSVSWSFVDGQVVVVPNTPVTLVSYPNIAGLGQVRQFVTTRQLSLSRLIDGGGRDVFGMVEEYSYSYPDNPELPGSSMTTSRSVLAIGDDAGNRPYLAAEFPALLALPTSGASTQTSTGYLLFDFQVDGTGLRDDGVAFAWSLNANGGLRVVYGDGALSVYTRLTDDGRKGDGVVAVHTEAGGARSAAWSLSTKFDGSLAFDTMNLARSWRSGFDISQAAYEPAILGLYVVLNNDAARSGELRSRNAVDGIDYRNPLTWGLNGALGAMEATEYFDSTGRLSYCTIGVNGCGIWLQRRWMPLALDGDRVYVIEELLWDSDGDGDLEVNQQRANFYDIQAPPTP